jgi:putative membrane protein insertion efficiency factor
VTARPAEVVGITGRAVVRALIYCIQLYRHAVSPLRLPTCRFLPTCSQYAVDALTEYGLMRGSWLTAMRLAKCGPWHRGGWDPVPERRGRADDCGADVSGTPAKRRERASFV